VSEKPQSRPVHFGIKEWVGIASLLALGLGVLGYFVDNKIAPVETDLKHHAEVDMKRDTKSEKEIEKLQKKDEQLFRSLHRIELRQVGRRAPLPAHIRDRPLPVELPE
jgi:hypothetical protein